MINLRNKEWHKKQCYVSFLISKLEACSKDNVKLALNTVAALHISQTGNSSSWRLKYTYDRHTLLTSWTWRSTQSFYFHQLPTIDLFARSCFDHKIEWLNLRFILWGNCMHTNLNLERISKIFIIDEKQTKLLKKLKETKTDFFTTSSPTIETNKVRPLI